MTHKWFHRLRWLIMLLSFLFLSYGVRLLGHWLASISLPIFSCTLNTDQVISTSSYNFTHLNTFLANGITMSVISYLLTYVVLAVLFGRMFCGFICPMGFMQDILWKVSDILHVEKFSRKEKFMKIINVCKYLFLLCFFGLTFIGLNFCNFCPAVITLTGLSGFRTHLTVGYFLGVIAMILSFFMRRFWCNICPMGYLVGLFHKICLFRIKKDCTACTMCAACYESCPMRIKTIYTENKKEDVTTSECIFCGECIRKCPENGALSITFCGKKIYTASRKDFEANQFVNLTTRKKDGELTR